MWLLPVFSGLCGIAVRVFYRFEVQGPSPPRTGPLLLVANHPNSLVDPALVTAAARRPVRFLAKAPLFTHRLVGWLVRASGAIPVYRRSDDPALASRNRQMFAAVFAALSDGAAIGIFPEGITHSEPALAALKTGGARIALGFAARDGADLAVVPTGLVLRDKGQFRSEAIVVHGPPLEWADLAFRGEDDVEAVHELTRRIDEALRRVTLNLESWEDRPLVEGAQAIWAAEIAPDTADQDTFKRIQIGADVLKQLRLDGDPQTATLAREVTAHCRRLRRLGLEPSDLGARVDLESAVRWTARRVVWLGPPAALVACCGFLLYLLPYEATRLLSRAANPPPTQRSTHQILIGALVYTLWIVLVALSVGHWFGVGWGILSCVVLPLIGIVGLRVRERWRGYWSDMRRFFLIRSRVDLIRHLRQRQHSLAIALDRLGREWWAAP